MQENKVQKLQLLVRLIQIQILSWTPVTFLTLIKKQIITLQFLPFLTTAMETIF